MVAQFIKNFNQENIIENKIDFYRLNNILIYIMIINKIISLIIRIFRREKIQIIYIIIPNGMFQIILFQNVKMDF